MAKLGGVFPKMGGPWTARAPLPGGEFPVDGAAALARELAERFPFLDPAWAGRLVRGYGTEAAVMLDGARTAADLGERFGWDLTEREVRWLMEREWALTAEDVLWRRTKLGLRLSGAEAARLGAFMGAEALDRDAARVKIS
jgi:glycerol-3-phosphate dehydrogenase